VPYDKNETKGSPASHSGRTERRRGPSRVAGQTFGALDGSPNGGLRRTVPKSGSGLASRCWPRRRP
jgi:hypothetical protein